MLLYNVLTSPPLTDLALFPVLLFIPEHGVPSFYRPWVPLVHRWERNVVPTPRKQYQDSWRECSAPPITSPLREMNCTVRHQVAPSNILETVISPPCSFVLSLSQPVSIKCLFAIVQRYCCNSSRHPFSPSPVWTATIRPYRSILLPPLKGYRTPLCRCLASFLSCCISLNPNLFLFSPHFFLTSLEPSKQENGVPPAENRAQRCDQRRSSGNLWMESCLPCLLSMSVLRTCSLYQC